MIPIPPGLLLTLLRKYWLHAMIAVAVLAVAAAIYHEGGRAPRAELAQFRAEVARERAEVEADQEVDAALTAGLVRETEMEGERRADTINRAWDQFVAGLDAGRVPDGGDVRPAQKPVAGPAGCADVAADRDRLLGAVQVHRDDYRRAIEGERRQAAELLRACQLQTDALVRAQGFAAGARAIHATPEAEGSASP